VDAIKESFSHLLIYEVNGFLALMYVLWEHISAIITAGAMTYLILGAPSAQRTWITATAILAILAALFTPPPVPLIMAVMALAGAIAVWRDTFNPENLRWRITGGLALYALAALGYLAYSHYLDGVDAMTWAKTLGGEGQAAAALAQGRAFVNTLATWGLWLIIPLGYFSLLAQSMVVHPPGPQGPGDLITTIRTRGHE
jgi:hypothetical protein